MAVVTVAINSIEQVEVILKKYVENARQYIHDGLTLERMWPMLESVGNPHKKLKVIHVAGTSGKTSTAFYIAGLLHASGKKVGLTVSPHVDSITERVQINGRPITDIEFCSEISEFLTIIEETGSVQSPSYFELMIVFALWEFSRQGVDYAVIETGLGGLLDSTNVVTRKDKVCVITDIGLDHQAILGSTIAEIAGQKAGIIHGGNHVFMNTQSEEVMAVFKKKTEVMNAIISINDPRSHVLIEDTVQLALFQRRNYSLARTVAKFVAERDGFVTVSNFNPLDVVIKGRMEEMIVQDGSMLIMDGAHNAQKMSAFVASFQAKYPEQKATILLALKQGKEYTEVVDALKPITQLLIVTTFSVSQDVPISCLDPEAVAAYANSVEVETVIFKDNKEAYQALHDTQAEIKIITGSFYLLGQMRALL